MLKIQWWIADKYQFKFGNNENIFKTFSALQF